MAQEDRENDGDSPSTFKRYGPFAVVVIVVQIAVAWVLIEFVFKDGPATQPYEDLLPHEETVVVEKGQRAGGKLPYYYKSAELKNITSNPAGTNAERVVMASVQIGLVGYDHSKKPPKDDITGKLGENVQLLKKIDLHAAKMKSIITKVLRNKTIDQLDGDNLALVEEEIRRRINDEIFKRVFVVDAKHHLEISVQEVDFSDIIIQ